MTTAALILRGRGRAGLPVWLGSFLLVGLTVPTRGEMPEVPAPPGPDFHRAPVVPPQAILSPSATPSAPASSQRIRLFRIQPGFLSEIRWLDQDDHLVPEARPAEGDMEERVTLNVGNDNPYFDFRRRSDPGGVGFTRVNTQVELFDTGRTACSLGMQAVTPAGQEFDGLPDRLGPTVLMPALSIFHELEDGLAVQAFVGKDVPVMNGNTQPVRRDLHYGVAVQRPLVPGGQDFLGHLYLSLGALGQHRVEKEARVSIVWELLPGLHYRVTDSWWISGGLCLPVGATRAETGQYWQVTCSLQF